MATDTRQLLAMRDHVRLVLDEIDSELAKRERPVRDRDYSDYRPHR
jgi:hypothetical protein